MFPLYQDILEVCHVKSKNTSEDVF